MKTLLANLKHREAPHRRRGSVLVFVLGVLTLLALIGLVLITRTHTESKRVSDESASTGASGMLGGVVRNVQETLRKDIWGAAPVTPLTDRPLSEDLPPGQVANPYSLLENNEPFDAPGVSDRWLASTVAYMGANEDPANVDPINNPRRETARDAANLPLGYEDKVLVWPYVSYLGSDINLPVAAVDPASANPFMWARNTRAPAVPQIVRYSPVSLEQVAILQTPPPAWSGLPMIPGSTTNVSIGRARAAWNDSLHLTTLAADIALQPALANVVPQFPYFDTNADGQVDLYDADGDGVPDSPISLVIPMDAASPNDPRTLYAAIRIVDHASMLNVNVASSLRLPTGMPADLMFDESYFTLQRRGQRATELLLDEVVHPADRFERTKSFVANRSGNNPVDHDFDVLRSKLLGSLQTTGPSYSLFGVSDEISLRHRGVLVPYEHRLDAAIVNDYRAIDRALPNSMMWSRDVDAAGTYIGAEARWSRLNADFGSAAYEGADSVECGPPVAAGCVRGWRSLMREDEPFALRRRLLTTVSKDVALPPDIAKGIIPAVPGVSPIDVLLDDPINGLWALGMDWPTLISSASPMASSPRRPANAFTNRFLVAPALMPADWARPQQIDLNMSDPANPGEAKAAFVRYAAAAMYLALDGVTSYQGLDFVDNPVTTGDEGQNRAYLAWQFALNLADYRDGDNEPSMIEWPVGSGRLLFGVEKQPFFTEALASVIVGTGAGPIGPVPEEPPTTPDQWFHAVELYVPPYWQILVANLALRTPGSGTGDIPLSSFVPAFTAPAMGGVLDGGTDGLGRYYVFCGPTTYAPPNLINAPVPGNAAFYFQNRAYRNNAFRISSDPSEARSVELVYTGASALETHALDVIGPANLVNDASCEIISPGLPASPSGWATTGSTPTTGQRVTTSLRRCTKGWRFPISTHVYSLEGPLSEESPCGTYEDSLGRVNGFLSDGLDRQLPEMPWAGRALWSGGEPVDTFGTGLPYTAFDSVGDLSRVFTFGHIKRPLGTEPPIFNVPGYPTTPGTIPLTSMLSTVFSSPAMSDLPDLFGINNSPAQRHAVGHLDFVSDNPTDTPWARRLLDFFTTSSHLFDGVDNDGDGTADLRNGDATEGLDVANAHAGRINLNTAPAAVLRAVPSLSFLPSSTEYLDIDPTSTGNQQDDFVNGANSGRFWDMASAIVAARENRDVPLRLWNSATGSMQLVANAQPAGPASPFARVADLAELVETTESSGLPNAEYRLFRYDRFTDSPASPVPLRLQNHKINAADPNLGIVADPFSPDFRFKRLVGNDGIIDYSAIPPTPPLPPGYLQDNGGIRARDILLSRASGITTTRSDVFTAYIALIDEDGNYVARTQVTLDRSDCFREDPEAIGVTGVRIMVMPRVLLGSGRWGSYEDDTR
jgi:hypothetical protein